MKPHSWIEPHPFQNLIQPRSKIGFETIEPQLEYNPTFLIKKISDFLFSYPLAVRRNFDIFQYKNILQYYENVWTSLTEC